MACNNSYAPILSEATCDEMRGKQGTCDRLIKACYTSGSRFACVPASIYCNNAMIGPVQQSGVNVYDVRGKCEEGNPLCYGIIGDIETYMNEPKVQKILGADREFKGCNMDVNKKFLLNGVSIHLSYLGLDEAVPDKASRSS
jgi:cathepsin A (carboxypeptidase C)